jgi:hypothetical protein
LIGYLGFIFFFNKKPTIQYTPKPIEMAHVLDYGAQAYIGIDTKHLLPYDVKLPIVEGIYIHCENGGHMVLNTNTNVEISFKDNVLVRFLKNGIDILEGEVSINHPSGKLPDKFQIFQIGKSISITDLPVTIK